MDGWMDRWMDGWMDRWMDGQSNVLELTLCLCFLKFLRAKWDRIGKQRLERVGICVETTDRCKDQKEELSEPKKKSHFKK